MTRRLFALAGLGLVLVAGRSPGFGPPVWVPCGPPPVVFLPAYFAPAPVFVPYSVPAPPISYPIPTPATAPLAPPKVHPESSHAPGESVEPPLARKPEQAPTPVPVVKPADFAAPKSAVPTPAVPDVPAVPPVAIPGKPPETTELPKPRPRTDSADIPVPSVPLSVPTPADKPKDPDGPKIELKTPVPTDPTLAPLKLPMFPDAGKETSTSRSSPLTGTGRPRVEVLTADGPVPAGGVRTVGFYNRTDRPVTVTVDGESMALPGNSYVSARVGAAFRWKLDGEAERAGRVPAGAPGVDVVIRR